MSANASLRLAQVLLHFSAAGVMTWGYQSLETTVLDSWIRTQTGGHFQFLTIQAYVGCALNRAHFDSRTM